jgi:hypothetical protein
LPFQGAGWYRPAVQGWQFNAILNYSDGLPFSVSAGSNTLYNGATSRANLLPGFGNGSLPSNKRTVSQWFNTAAFANPGAQQWGNSSPNILQGPGTKNVDFSVFKNIKLTEGSPPCNCAASSSTSSTLRSSTIRMPRSETATEPSPPRVLR